MKSGLDVVIEYHNAFSDEICDEMVERFESDGRATPGLSGIYGPDYKGKINKVSSDLQISQLSEWADMDGRIYNILTPYVSRYVDMLSKQFYYEELNHIKDLGYQIQRTDPGGYFNWHCDYDSQPLLDQFIQHKQGNPLICIRERIATYILYLNDRLEYGDDDGTTEFKFGDDSKIIKAEKGKLIMFPADPFYPHRGVPLKNGVKYLMTGWVTRDRVAAVTEDTTDYSERESRYSGTGPDSFMTVLGRGSWGTGT